MNEKVYNTPFTVYAVRIDVDERGPSRDMSYHSSQTAAKERAKGASWYGGDGKERKAIRLDDGASPPIAATSSGSDDLLDEPEDKAPLALLSRALKVLSC